MMKTMKPMQLLRVAGAIGILAWLLSKAGFSEVREHLVSASAGLLAIAVFAAAGQSFLRILNWRQLLHSMHPVRSGYLRLSSSYFYSALLGQFVPSTVGTDAIRVVVAHKSFGGSPAVYAASLVVLNAITLFVSAALGLGALLWLWSADTLPQRLVPAIPVLLAIVLLVPTVHFTLRSRRGLVVLALRKIRPRRLYRLRRGLRRFVDSLLVFERSPAAHIRGVLVTSFFVVFAQVCFFALMAGAFGVSVPLVMWLAVPSLMAIAGMLPLSIFGFGLLQGALVFLVTSFGVPPSSALACALVAGFVSTTVFLALGGIAFATWTGPSPSPTERA